MPTDRDVSRGRREYERGVELMQSGDHAAALSHLRLSTTLQPYGVVYFKKFAECLIALARFADAERALVRVCELEPDEEFNWWNLGNCLSNLGRFAESERAFRRACELDSDDNLNWQWLGHSLLSLGRVAEAEPAFRRACELKSENGINWHWLGHSLHSLGRFVEAEPASRRACELEPENGYIWFWLGRSLHSLGRFAEAERAFRRACELKPEDGINWHWLGHSLYSLGRFAEAVDALREACRLNPDDISHRVWLANALTERSGAGRDEAVAIYRKIIGDEPDSDWRAAALNNLGLIYWNEEDYATSCSLIMEAVRVRRRLKLEPDHTLKNLETYLDSPLLSDDVRIFVKQMWDAENRLLVRNDAISVAAVGFAEWLAAGSVWLDSASWSGREHSALLKELHASGAQWADPASYVFPEFIAGEEELDEALAFAENLSGSLRKQPDMPIHLDAADLRIAMTIENDHLRAWVGRETTGLAVSVNLKTWDVQYRADDRDAIFAVGAVLHWFLDCSGGIEHHPKFTRGLPTNEENVVPWRPDSNTWSTNSSFDDDVEAVVSGRRKRPPKAHRVKGHIRTLSEKIPTEEARLRAPAYVRRNMGPDDTWVAGYSKGGEAALRSLITRLATFSSLADYLATCPRDEA